MSCNGCRVLRKGCSVTCILRPCLQWIETAEAQGHATVFVAKFFGRAGLMGFIGAVPENQRPALFQSLLYEACGRTVNPVYGAVGLLWTGNWHVCQAAVETVLKGGTLRPSASLPAGTNTSQCLPGMQLPSVQRSNPASVPERTVHPSSSPSLSLLRCVEAPKSKRSRDEPHNGTLDWSVAYTDRQKRCGSIESDSVADCPGQQTKQQQHLDRPSFNLPGFTNQIVLWAPQRQFVQGAVPDNVEGVEARKNEQCSHTVGQHIAPVPVCGRPWTGEIVTSGSGCILNDQREVAAPHSDSIKLDLTLNSNPVPPRRTGLVNARVSSPNSTISVNSEGSVTSLDTADLSICRLPLRSPSPKEEHRLLDLLV